MSAVAAADPAVRRLDFPRLIRLVRLRRRLRVGTVLAVFAMPLWALVVIGVQAAVPQTDPLWDDADRAAGPGFVVLFVLFLLGILGLLLLRFLPHGARDAARIAPVFGKATAVELRQDGDAAPALAGLLVHRPRIPLGLVGMLLGGVLFSIATGVNAAPAFRGNHGSGGPVYTVGQEASPGRVDTTGRGVTYFLDTPQGSVVAEDGRPKDGQRWTVVHGSADMAYRVGGHAWLLVGLLFVVGVLFSLGVLAALVGRFVTEGARRQARQHVPLARALDQARTAGPLTLVLASGAERELTFDSLRGRPAARVLRRRRVVLTSGLLLVITGGGVLAGLYENGVVWPPATRDVRVPPLVAAGFPDDRVYVVYGDTDATLDLAHSALGQRPTRAWSAVLGSPADNPSIDANVAVIRLPNGVTGPAAVAGVAALDEQLRVFDHGPPARTVAAAAGWRAYVSGGAGDREGTFLYAGSGWLLWGTTDGTAVGDAQLGAVATQASVALSRYGEAHFATSTRRRR